MAITAGSRLGPYEVVSPLGAGGMGEVWKARDTRLERSVAIKVLPAEFAENAQLKTRFEREAKTISQLNHPHICTLYDVGDNYLVMELLEGESLAEKLARGPLPLDQVLRYGIQIAEALEKAHKAGVVHRDLKPGNVMITKSGAKLLDFGLAKPTTGGVLSALTSLRTEKRNLTEEGMLVGTFQYMAPEQLEGGEVDARTDIFALGAVLYEMATGKRAFEGKSKASLIASILTTDPQPITTWQPLTPPAFERLVRGCLVKDADERWQSAHDVAAELRWIAEAGPTAAAKRSRDLAPWIIAVLLFAAAVAFAYLWYRATSVPQRRLEVSILPPENSKFVFGASTPAVSPDGTRIAFPAQAADGKILLWIRRLDNGAVQSLPGTESATFPFWSPDSRSIAFYSSGKLRRVDAAGGPPQVICDSIVARGGTWAPSGDIVFAPNDHDVLYRVSASGGTATPVTTLDPAHEYSHRWPWFLPDGKHFLYLAQTFGSAQDRGRIYVGSLDSKERRLVVTANSIALYSPTGHLLYCRDRTLVAQPFDVRRFAVHGDPTPIAGNIYNVGIGAVAAVSVSQNGVLTYFNGTGLLSQLVWRDRAGNVIGTVGSPGEYQRPQLAHDGRHFAYEVSDAQGNSDIWIYDTARQTSTRFTFGPGANSNAIWSRDDRVLVYSSELLERGTRQIVRKPASGIGSQELLMSSTSPVLAITDWSPDGRHIIFHVFESHTKTSLDVGDYSIPDRKVAIVVQTPSFDCCGRLSPDGRWLVYTSALSGRNEIYVQPFPIATGRFQISTMGGTQGRWSSDGKELFYHSPDSRVMAVEVHAGESFEAGVPKPLFSIHPRPAGGPSMFRGTGAS
jgi:serine/threonine protein kinase/Tol biopolymer transport system component